ncbi:MAG TPA: hypothetical protein VIJ39_15685 [Solirubrobacteraceae bacterium]
MTRWLARLALRFYPLAFRRRYGEEMLALLEESPPRALAVIDLLRGAMTAHLRPSATDASLVDSADRMRASMSGQLACWVAFAVAGFGFYITTEDAPFTAAGRTHQLLGATHLAIQIIAVLASGAVLAGALPLIAAALGRARREPRLRRLVSLPPLAVLLFVGLTRLMELVSSSQPAHHTNSAGAIAFLSWGLAGLACAAVCVVAARGALFAVPMQRWRLVAAFACGTLVTAAMVAIAVATTLYGIALFADASHLAASGNGPFQLLSTGVSLAVQLLVMVLAATLAATSTRRGWRAVALD